MARVVQRRTSPPYLTIVFVFLFLVATTLAVVFYLSADKTNKNAASDRELLESLITNREKADVRDLMKVRGSTVVGQLLGQNAELSLGTTDPSTELAGDASASNTRSPTGSTALSASAR